MTPEKQRIAIAEACGKNVEMYENGIEGFLQFCCNSKIPDYLNDLNAMHEAEQILWGIDWNNRYVFNDHLASILRGRTINRNEWDAETLLDATAAQRAKAFLKTLNLWKQ